MLGASSQSYRRAIFSANDPGAVVAQIFFAIIDTMGLTVLVFMRRDFGERFFTPLKYVMGIAILASLIAFNSMAGMLMGFLPLILPAMLGMNPMIGLLAGPLLASHSHHGPAIHPLFDAASLLYHGFMIAGLIHLAMVFRRSWKIGNVQPVFSRSTGEPLLMLGGRVPYFIATIILEPVAVLLAGDILHWCDPRIPYGYFWMLAVFLSTSALHQYRLYKDDLLDQQDAQLMAGFFTEQVKRVSTGQKPTSNLLGRFFRPLLLPRQSGMQVDVLRQWAKQHQEAAGVEALPAAPAASDTEPPHPPPQDRAA